MDLITVIIPTYNRFKYLLNTIESVKNQTYKNIEIIIVNDCSTQEEYYKTKFEGCIVINLDKNNEDDYWMPNKLEKTIEIMKTSGCLMSCTDGYFGSGIYDKSKKYKIYNKEKYQNTIKSIFNNKGKGELMKDGLPLIWNKEFMNIHNCCIASSVMIEKSIIDKVGYFSNQLWAPDYEYWKRIIEHTDCIYLDEPLVFYDSGHGEGQNY
jgi:glycosyltransferase involved in cell wall biosynthesis